jgi:triosephosphate isomerase (TIM)
MKLFIHKILVGLYGRTAALRVHILYGGSVHQQNAEELIEKGEVDGFLVGGSSLKPLEFSAIIKAASRP